VNLVARFIGRKVKYLISAEEIAALEGKAFARVGDEMYAPFDSATEAAAWAMERTKRKVTG
jgi:hypothetical protein